MKTTFQIRTGDFEYIMQEFEGTPEEAVQAFKALKSAWSGGDGLAPKDFDYFLDTYLFDGTASADVYAAMNPEQQKIIQTIKRSLKRIKRNEPEIQ